MGRLPRRHGPEPTVSTLTDDGPGQAPYADGEPHGVCAVNLQGQDAEAHAAFEEVPDARTREVLALHPDGRQLPQTPAHARRHLGGAAAPFWAPRLSPATPWPARKDAARGDR